LEEDELMKTKFGILGCGGIAKRFAGALKLSGSGELYAAAARDESRAREMIEKFGGQKAYGSYLELIEDPNVEIVYISLVHSLHYEVAKHCVEHGKPVICEKPFFITEKEAVALRDLARGKGVLVMEAMWTRCLPAFLKAKEWAGSGAIGEIKLIDAAFCFNFPYDPQHRLFNPETAGGALLDAGVYPYDFITGILGEAPAEIKAVARKAPNGVDEAVVMALRFDSGVLASAVTSVGVNASETAHIYGTKGSIKVHRFLRSRKCELLNEDDEVIERFTDDQEEGFVYEIEHVVDLFRKRQTESPLIPMKDSIDFARAADAVRAQCGFL
jgi:predicted dehydrogenase